MTEKVVPKGELMLHYAQKTVSDPKYFLNFTIGKLEDGRVRTIDLGSNAAVEYWVLVRHIKHLHETGHVGRGGLSSFNGK